MVLAFLNRAPVPNTPPEESVQLAILIAGFLGPLDITEIRGKLSGRCLPWQDQDYPKTVRKLRATQLRIDWIRLSYLKAGESYHSASARDVTMKAGLDDKQVARLVIPIQTSDNVVVSSWARNGAQVDRRFPTGALCYIDQRRVYGIKNAGQIMAIYLSVDVYGSDALRTLIRASAPLSGRQSAAQA